MSLAIMGMAMLWLGPVVSVALIWVGAALLGLQIAWIALGMLAVVTQTQQHQAGRASGMVSGGFGVGLAAGPPVFGFTVDMTGAYHVGFVFLLGMMFGSGALMALWLKRDPPPESSQWI